MKSLKYSLAALLLVFTSVVFSANQLDLQFTGHTADLVNNKLLVYTQIRRVDAGWDKLGSSNFTFYYNKEALSNPTLEVRHNFNTGNYEPITLTDNDGSVSINIVLNVKNQGQSVTEDWMFITVLQFVIIDPSKEMNLTWRNDFTFAAYDDDQITALTPRWLINYNTAEPIELSMLKVENRGKAIELIWATATEENNLGFRVYRRKENQMEFIQLNQELVPGMGTSSSPKGYNYLDETVESGYCYFYKLASVSTDGKLEFFGPIQISTTVKAPESFSLEQNYPNPFNMTTSIPFSLPESAQIRLQVFSIHGELIQTLANGIFSAGNHQIRWLGDDSDNNLVSSGVYLVRIQSDKIDRTIKVLLTK